MTQLERQLQDELNRTIGELRAVTQELYAARRELAACRPRMPEVPRRVRSVSSRELVGTVYDVGSLGVVVDWDHGRGRTYMVFDSLEPE